MYFYSSDYIMMFILMILMIFLALRLLKDI